MIIELRAHANNTVSDKSSTPPPCPLRGSTCSCRRSIVLVAAALCLVLLEPDGERGHTESKEKGGRDGRAEEKFPVLHLHIERMHAGRLCRSAASQTQGLIDITRGMHAPPHHSLEYHRLPTGIFVDISISTDA